MLRLPAALTGRLDTAARCLLLTALALLAVPINAGQLNGQFNVTVKLQAAAAGSTSSSSAFCRSSNMTGSFGAAVTVVCATGAGVEIAPSSIDMPGASMPGGAYRYLIHARRGDELLGTIDSYVGAGTAISWRVVNLTDWYYLEMLANW